MPFTLAKIEDRSRITKQDPTDDRRSAGHSSASAQPAPALSSLGTELKAARLEKMVTLQQVAEETHISLRHLQNLEEGQYRALPGGMYNRAFLRSYCVYLELDPDAYLERYEKESAPHGEKSLKPKTPSPHLPSEGLRIPPLLIWSLMFLASVVGLYFSRGWIAAVFSPYFSHPPAARLATSEANLPQAQTKAAETPPVSAPIPTTEPPTRPSDTASVSVSAQASVGERVPGAIHLQFQVVQLCWMSVTGDGKRLASKLFQPGDDESFDANESFDLILGNAGGVNLKINGKPAKPLGKSGEVVKLQINLQNIPDLLEKLAG